MIKQFIKGIALFTAASICLSGCSSSGNDQSASETDATKMVVIDDINQLENYCFYIRHNDKYYPVYLNNNSYPAYEHTIYSSPSNNRTLFFNEDWEKIPTCYKGDALVYYATDTLPDSFMLERFEDKGYSFGICNLQYDAKKEQYYFYTTSSDGRANTNINPASDFYRLVEMYPNSTFRIFNLGENNYKLTTKQVSRGGTIEGLEKDGIYPVDIAKGSEPKRYEFKADTRILTSWETLDISKCFTYSKTKTIEFTFPDYMENGYYMINGQGIFRYIKGTTFVDGVTSVNFQTKIPKASENQEESSLPIKIKSSSSAQKKSILINDKGVYKIVITISDSGDDSNIAEPNIKLITKDEALSFNNDGNNVYSLEREFEPGKYDIEITQLFGQSIEKIEQFHKKDKKNKQKEKDN